ncbi:hypothetical protein PIB30_092303 [Stylosanthes scabra]|uniref:Zinc knuckle CX2CX4HX4C domain-containing protein n=1 Tax=Stylosanthes scabra TaxID=79078 RepID=A0ABU6QX92_9FABA|nr:hypothetical protein [Stylosanthes scabra]
MARFSMYLPGLPAINPYRIMINDILILRGFIERCCGYLGHEVRNCDLYLQLSMADTDVNLSWRADLRANQIRWRAATDKENWNPNSHDKIPSFNQTSEKPTPVSLIKSFASLSCKDKGLDKSATGEDSVSSIPTMLFPQGSQTVVQPPFTIGSNTNTTAKRNKRQKLKDMACKGSSGVEIQNIIGLKRPTDTSQFEAEIGDNIDSTVFTTEGEQGANPLKAPMGQ